MAQMTLDIAAQTVRPPSQSGWIKISVDSGGTHVFTLANFTTETTPPYVGEDALDQIRIVTLPTIGTLTLSGVVINFPQEISHTDLSLGNLVYTPVASKTGGYVDNAMTFLVSDQTSLLFTTSPQLVAFSVGSGTNKLPSNVGNGEATSIVGTPIVFTRAMLTTDLDGPYSDPEADPADKLLITDVPTVGRLELSGSLVVDNDIIDFIDIDAGNLIYITNEVPKPGTVLEFKFKISDTGSGEFKG